MSKLPEFPASPVTPSAFMQEFLPRTFAALGVAEAAGGVDVAIGVALSGEGGGEWRVEVVSGDLRVVEGSREGAALTVLQSVDDWRGALWEGRGGFFGRQAGAIFQPGSAGGLGDMVPGSSEAGAPNLAAFEPLSTLDGRIDLVVAEPEGSGEPDWQVSFKLGPGPVPEEATTAVRIEAADSEAMERGELDPMTAFMMGQLEVSGDMTLMLQLQAVVMQAMLPPID